MKKIIENLLSELENDICRLQMSAEKADVMTNTITNDYFCDIDTDSTNGKAMLCYYFDSARIKHNILSDYVDEINLYGEKINQIWKEMHDAISNENSFQEVV